MRIIQLPLGYVNIVYHSFLEKVFAYLGGRPVFYHLHAQDVDGNLRVRVLQSIRFFQKAEWKVELYSYQHKIGSFLVQDISFAGAASTLAFEFKGQQILIKRTSALYKTQFIASNTEVIAECDVKDIPQTLYIQVIKPELDIYLITTLALIHFYWDIIV